MKPNEPNPNSNKKPTGDWKAFFALLRQAKPSYGMFAAAFALSLINTVVSLFVPLFTRNLVDGFSLQSIRFAQIAAIGGAFLVQTAAGAFSIFLFNRFGQQMLKALRSLLWRKLLHLPVSHYDKEETGALISRVTNDTGVIKQVMSELLSGFITGVISIIGSVVILLTLDWQMTLVLLIAVPLTLGILFPLGRQMYRISRSMQDETAGFTSILQQVLSEIRLVKSSGAEAPEYARGMTGIQALYRLGLKEARVQALIAPLMGLVIMTLMVVVIGFGGLRVSSGALSAGELVAFLLYLIQIIMPLGQITGFFTQLQKAMGAAQNMIATLGKPEEIRTGGKPLPQTELSLRLDRVSFAYNGGNGPVLDEVSFPIPTGKVTALVGPSGSGKTTLFSLIERFYEPTGGRVLYGDEPITTYDLPQWRARIGYVSQESPLMSGTIRDNIAYGLDREVSDDELRQAAAMAYADAFIDELPHQYDTEVGERGIKLSGGQRQRIAIARALLRDPQLLMLDEATSSLDSKSESVVQQALANLMQGRTTLVIAHRLSTVVDADQIVFLDKGSVTGIGTHEELAASHPLYREFAEQQLRYAEQPAYADHDREEALNV
ncbi:ABC transporter ATP-binding protein [Cohnella candidum]|uniref:ABC transporter ATP-binding protein n=1 Tax=Cohnella candidum TaxID=2674991 RepID=A0A3G3K647_9BACL|nr:ABC transporter ATP-binding protein [Cohnella candidum]AYQ75547.1 ABC transporter ATP-binding protein [Cohnella candidum]